MSTDRTRIEYWKIRIRIQLNSDLKIRSGSNPMDRRTTSESDPIWIGWESDLIRIRNNSCLPFNKIILFICYSIHLTYDYARLSIVLTESIFMLNEE